MDVNTQTSDKPDAGDIDRNGLTMRPCAALSDAGGFMVVVPKPAWDRMLQHAHVRLDVEVGGVLVGRTYAAENGEPYLLIEAIVPAVAAESRETNITFTADAWTRIHEVIDRDHPDGTIVGWYHTHPAFGIFLSEMDVFICRHFFDLPHQVAMVIEGEAASATTPATRLDAAKVSPEPQQSFRSARRSLLRRLAGLIHPLTRLDRAQWLALFFLIAIAALLFGALVMLWLKLSPAELVERIRSLVNRFTSGGATS